jgi:hypothetical protein
MPICVSVFLSAWNNSAVIGQIAMKFEISLFVLKSVEKVQVSLKSEKSNGYFIWRLFTFVIISRWILLRMRNVSDKMCIEKKTRILVSITFVQKSCRLWDNVEKYGVAREATDDNIIRCMRFAR